MNNPKILYILIGIFCVFAIIAGIYAEFIDGGTEDILTGNNGGNEIVEKDAETIKNQLNNLFTSTINLNGYDTSRIKKLDESKEIIYTVYDIVREEELYGINIKIPVVNINSSVANDFNTITQLHFVNKANEILTNTDETKKTLYSIDYAAFINDDILSVIIRSTLKESTSAQRIIIQTYNYNLETGEQVELIDLITSKILNKEDVNKKIKEVVQQADIDAKAVQSMGYNDIYTRDLNDARYSVDGATTYILGPNKELYIIYAYGNNNFTSEMDIVLFE